LIACEERFPEGDSNSVLVIAEGFLVRSGLDAVAHYRDAMKLATRYAAQYLIRTLDVLNVAAALLLEAKILASFDERRRRLAAGVGLKLLPETLR